MKKTPYFALVLALFAASAGCALAQDASRTPTTPATQVGDATQRLFALQRDGGAASPTPRPIAGDVATLSYQRYLDSFKRPIPDHFSTTVRSAGGARPAQ